MQHGGRAGVGGAEPWPCGGGRAPRRSPSCSASTRGPAHRAVLSLGYMARCAPCAQPPSLPLRAGTAATSWTMPLPVDPKVSIAKNSPSSILVCQPTVRRAHARSHEAHVKRTRASAPTTPRVRARTRRAGRRADLIAALDDGDALPCVDLVGRDRVPVEVADRLHGVPSGSSRIIRYAPPGRALPAFGGRGG
jgi:hypothetical protein